MSHQTELETNCQVAEQEAARALAALATARRTKIDLAARAEEAKSALLAADLAVEDALAVAETALKAMRGFQDTESRWRLTPG